MKRNRMKFIRAAAMAVLCVCSYPTQAQTGDQIFGVTISPENGENSIQYYILAENAAASSFAPDSYMFEPYTSNLAELNN